MLGQLICMDTTQKTSSLDSKEFHQFIFHLTMKKLFIMGPSLFTKPTNQGITWEKISPDLTEFDPSKQVISGSPITRDVTGEEFYSTIYSIRESNIEKGQIWVGSNDGLIHITRDGGKSWKNVTPKV